MTNMFLNLLFPGYRDEACRLNLLNGKASTWPSKEAYSGGACGSYIEYRRTRSSKSSSGLEGLKCLVYCSM